MKKSFVCLLVMFISLNLLASITHIWPSSGVNDTSTTVHVFGDGFNSGVTNVDLYKSGNPLIAGTNISVVNDNYLTCQFDLTGAVRTTYNLIVNSDSFYMCFTVNRHIYYPTNWHKTNLGNGGSWMKGIAVGDGNNDGELEVYGANRDDHIYQFKWNGSGWDKTDLGFGGSQMYGVCIGDGNNDGELEVYGANEDHYIYQFKWNGSTWDKTDLGSPGGWIMGGVAVGDGNNDGELEVYGANYDDHIYQYKWNGSTWVRLDVGNWGNIMRGVAVGDGNNDGELEVYGANNDGHIYQFKWEGSYFDFTDLGSGGTDKTSVVVGDGNNDGELEVYGASGDGHISQFKFSNWTWNRTDLGFGGWVMSGVAVGDGNNDGELEVYGANYDDHIYQFKWDGSSWDKKNLGSANEMLSVAIGDGNNDGDIEVYGGNTNYHLYQFKVIPEPKMILSDTFHDFSYTAFHDTSHWQYLILENIGDSFLVIDSIISSNSDFSVFNYNVPDTLNIDDSSLVEVILSPTVEGMAAGTLAVFSSDPNSAQYIYLLGCCDTTSPDIVNLIAPEDSSYCNYPSINFIYSRSSDTLSGMDYYQLNIFYDAFTDTSLIDTNLIDTVATIILSDNIYFWRVKAVDRAGNESPWSEFWSFEVDLDNPSIPYLINPIGGNFYSNDTVDFSWTESSFKDSESPVRYVFEADTLSTFIAPMTVDTVDINTIEKVLSEDFYYWHVKAFDLAGNESPFSDPDSFGIDMTPPVIESTTVWVDTTYQGPFTVNVKISDNALDTCYLYYKRVEDPDFQIITLSATGSNWFTGNIPQVYLNPDTVKYYIYAEDIAIPANITMDPTGAPSSYYSFVVNSVGVSEILEIPAIFTFSYSYPSAGEIIFNLAIPEVSEISLKIFDISGREVSNLISGQLSPAFYNIPFRPFSKGTYFYRLESSYQTKNGKFIIVE